LSGTSVEKRPNHEKVYSAIVCGAGGGGHSATSPRRSTGSV